jgi:hypothetical protein
MYLARQKLYKSKTHAPLHMLIGIAVVLSHVIKGALVRHSVFKIFTPYSKVYMGRRLLG